MSPATWTCAGPGTRLISTCATRSFVWPWRTLPRPCTVWPRTNSKAKISVYTDMLVVSPVEQRVRSLSWS